MVQSTGRKSHGKEAQSDKELIRVKALGWLSALQDQDKVRARSEVQPSTTNANSESLRKATETMMLGTASKYVENLHQL